MSQQSLEMLSAWSWKDSEVGSLNKSSGINQRNIDHLDLISFLAVVQELDINIMPITWNDGLNSIGFGGTAVLREAMVDLNTSFAFKHVVGKSSEEREKSFRTLINEITILGQPSFQAHPNVVTLHGICWHTPTGEERVEPALVFEKAENKDLYGFMETPSGAKTTFSERMRICVDLAQGLTHGHQYGVLHGDVKPQNVLIFGDDGSYTAKSADYGFSSLDSCGDVAMAISRPWEAPELISCDYSPKYTFATAKRAEFYSFGLLCFWLLFYQHQIPISGMTVGRLFTQEGISTLQHLKQEDKLLDIALKLLEQYTEISSGLKNELGGIFRCLLTLDPKQRFTSFESLLSRLEAEDNEYVNLITPLGIPVAPVSVHFEVFKSLDVLTRSHLIVRKYIVFSLKEQLKTASCTVCRTNAIKQLWFCASLGFGNPLAGSVNEDWKLNDLVSRSEIDTMLDMTRRITVDSPRRDIPLQAFEDHGFLGALEYSEEHVKTPIQDTLNHEYPMEIAKMAQALGSNHALVYTLRFQYCTILFRQGAYREALPLASALCTEYRYDVKYGPEHFLTQHLIFLLGAIHWALGEFQEASNLERDLLKIWEKTQGTKNLGYLHLQRSHASTLRDQGNYKEAEAMEQELLKTATAVLGAKHPTTLSVMANLAVTYSNVGKFTESEELEIKVLKAREEVLGSRHRDTVMAMANLAFTYRDLARYDDAEALEKIVVSNRQDIFGLESPETLRSMINLSNTWMNQGYFAEDNDKAKHDLKFREAQDLILRVVEISKRVLGEDHPDTLMAISSLAHCYRNTGHPVQAKELDLQLIERRTSTLGERHPATLKSIFNYALTLKEMGAFKEAKYQATLCLNAQIDVLGSDHPLTIETQLFLESLKSRPTV